MSKHISRNRGGTIKASQKIAYDKVFILGLKGHFFCKKWQHYQKIVIALNLYIGTNVLVYERWLVLKVWYMAARPAGPTLSPLHKLTLLMHVSQKTKQCF